MSRVWHIRIAHCHLTDIATDGINTFATGAQHQIQIRPYAKGNISPVQPLPDSRRGGQLQRLRHFGLPMLTPQHAANLGKAIRCEVLLLIPQGSILIKTVPKRPARSFRDGITFIHFGGQFRHEAGDFVLVSFAPFRCLARHADTLGRIGQQIAQNIRRHFAVLPNTPGQLAKSVHFFLGNLCHCILPFACLIIHATSKSSPRLSIHHFALLCEHSSSSTDSTAAICLRLISEVLVFAAILARISLMANAAFARISVAQAICFLLPVSSGRFASSLAFAAFSASACL
nr:MAG TPA: hypothetical protein [Caudoviricetes sp.]